MTTELDFSVSVVVYKNSPDTLKKLFECISKCGLNYVIYVIDNSPTMEIEGICMGQRLRYIFNNKNIGFGAAHNIAVKKALWLSKYHLIINPDVSFNAEAISKIFNYMENNSGVGLLMPKILYPDGSLQYLCRLLPTPIDLFLRKVKIPYFSERQNFRYELRFTSYNQIMSAPYLSGCFMFIRNEVFKKIGFFDERFFMYLEDVDLSRRIHKYYRTVYYPASVIYHEYGRDSGKDIRLFLKLIISAVKYFNKWGWFFDKERSLINDRTLQKIQTDTLEK